MPPATQVVPQQSLEEMKPKTPKPGNNEQHEAAPALVLKQCIVSCIFDAITVIGPALPLTKMVKEHFNGSHSRAQALLSTAATTNILLAFFLSPLVGVVSDRHGRIPVLFLVRVLQMFARFAILCGAYLMTAGNWIGVWLVTAGLMLPVDMDISLPLVQAVVADVYHGRDRIPKMTMLTGSMRFGMILARPIFASLFEAGKLLPFVSATFCAAFGVWYITRIPETCPTVRQAADGDANIDGRESNPDDIMRTTSNPFERLRDLRRLSSGRLNSPASDATVQLLDGGLFVPSKLMVHVVVQCCVSGAQVMARSTLAMYVDWRFEEDVIAVAVMMSSVHIAFACYQILLVPTWLKNGFSAEAYMKTALLVGCLGCAFAAWAPNIYLFAIGFVAFALGWTARPVGFGFLSNKTHANLQGRLMAGVGGATTLGMLFGSSFGGYMFTTFSTEHPPFEFKGAPYYVASLLIGFACVLAVCQF